MPKLTTEHFEKNREHILQAAEACFSEKGFHKTNMRDIAQQAGLSLGNIYRYFDSKEELIEAFVTADLQDLTDALDLLDQDDDIHAGFARLIEVAVNEMGDRKQAALSLQISTEALQNDRVMAIIHHFGNEAIEALTVRLQQAEKKGLVKLKLDARLCARSVYALLEHTAYSTLFIPNYSREQAITDANQAISVYFD